MWGFWEWFRGAITGPIEDHAVGVVAQPIQRRGPQQAIRERIAPLAEVQIAGDDGGALLIALADQVMDVLVLWRAQRLESEVKHEQFGIAQQGHGLTLGAQGLRSIALTQGAQGLVSGHEQPGVSGADDLRQDRTGQMRLAGAGAAEQEQIITHAAQSDEPLGVGLADLAGALLLRHAGLVVGEGLALEPRRDATAPEGDLQAALRGLLTLGKEFADLGTAVFGQRLSRQQRLASRGCPRAESRR